MPAAASSRHPRTGLTVTIIGTAIILLAAVVYLAIGNAIAGIIGILFVVVIAFFLRGGQNTTDAKSKQLAGLIPFVIGWVIMILDGTALAFDLVVLVGALLLVVGGAALTAGK